MSDPVRPDVPPFTPGPWRYDARNWRNEEVADAWYVTGDPREDYGEDDEDEDDRGRVTLVTTSVCIVPRNTTSHPVCEANARLIAASPAMYHALTDALHESADGSILLGADTVAKMRAALALANGEAK